MTLNLPRPILYLITRGETTETTKPDGEEFQNILQQVSAAVTAGIPLIQIREKRLTARVLFELTSEVVAIAQGSSTQVLVNDRADIASSARANGVHLTTHSMAADVIRKTFGSKLLVGVSTHSPAEAQRARSQGANFAVFGPIFPSPAKEKYGAPLGLGQLKNAVRELAPFPLIALGGISLDRVTECLLAGASGIAGITLFSRPAELAMTTEAIKDFATVNRRRTAR